MKEIKEKKEKEKVKGKRFLNLMYGIIAIVFILTFIIIPLAERSQRTYIVTSGSMEPDLKVGDIILVSKAKPEDIEVGDIITFKQPGSPMTVTHRCIAIKNQSDVTNFQANGDANNTDEISFSLEVDFISVICISRLMEMQITLMKSTSKLKEMQMKITTLLWSPGKI